VNSSFRRLIASRYVGGAAAVTALVAGGALTTATSSAAPDEAAAPAQKIEFEMVRSSGAEADDCIEGAGADVTVKELGAVEKMTIKVHDLPAETEFDVFVLQSAEFPFGVSWCQGDLTTDQSGNGKLEVRGRFNEETFAVANDSADAPTPHGGDDAAENPPFEPVHTFHLGMWFNSPDDAADAGCSDFGTPFNGDHTAGVQALSTRNFGALDGPLGDLS